MQDSGGTGESEQFCSAALGQADEQLPECTGMFPVCSGSDGVLTMGCFGTARLLDAECPVCASSFKM